MRLVETAGLIATTARTLPRFKLVRPSSIAEAAAAIQVAERPTILAGGTDLPAGFNEGFMPDSVVDISKIDELKTIEVSGGALRIGALVTHADGAKHPLVLEHLPTFAKAWSRIANVRVRFSATLGGNLMARRTRYEGAILLAALEATFQFWHDGRESELPAQACFDTPPRSLLTSIVIPLRAGLRLDYDRSMRPMLTQAVALDAAGRGRVVVATEFIRPSLTAIVNGAPADAVMSELSGDPVVSAAYLARMRNVILARQLDRLQRQHLGTT